jgi:hypothetical protein
MTGNVSLIVTPNAAEGNSQSKLSATFMSLKIAFILIRRKIFWSKSKFSGKDF